MTCAVRADLSWTTANPAAHRPRLLAAKIEASIAEFNRLAALATSLQVHVVAVVSEQTMPDAPVRPILAVQVIALL